jgi:23S rRNA (guanosine2251-2'-O)-methyltransferase
LALRLRNPHSVLAALRARPQDVIEVRPPAGGPSDAWAEVARLAKAQRIPLLPPPAPSQRAARADQRNVAGGRGGAAEATVKERAPISLEELFERRQEPGSNADGSRKRRRLWLALDQIQDPHNVGALFRTAAFFGVAGVVLTRDRSAPLNGTVYDVASGGLEVVPFAQPANLSRALDLAREKNLWVLGASEHATTDIARVDRDRSWVLVLGNEERGLRRLTASKCDETCRIPSRGPVGSLNVSVAGGILMAALCGSCDPAAASG